MRRVFCLALLAALAAAPAATSPAANGIPCPKALALGRNPIAPGSRAALAHESKSSDPVVTAAAVAPHDPERGGQVRHDCGRAVWQRTVVVHITLRALLPSASLSERVDFVSRTAAGWRVWEVAH